MDERTMNPVDCRENLRKLKLNLYALGEKIENLAGHRLFETHINAAAAAY